MKKVGKWFLPETDELFTKWCYGRENTKYGHEFQTKYIDAIINNTSTYNNIIDAGANIGLFSYAFSQVFNNVYSFEPVPLNFECLDANLNTIQNIHLHKCALGDKVDTVPMLGRLKNTGSFRIVNPSTGVKKHEGYYENIQVNTLDSFKLKDISVIKIDCEGFEHNVLLGAINTIRENKPLLCIEFTALNKGGSSITHSNVNKLLEELNYKKVWEGNDDAIFRC